MKIASVHPTRSSPEAVRADRWLRVRLRRDMPRRGASVKLLEGGVRFVPAIEEALAGARRQILFETYMIQSDRVGGRLVNILCERARQGVGVWVVVDAIGSSKLSSEDRRRMSEAGVHLRAYHAIRLLRPLHTFFRTHRRIVVVDERMGYVGGFGFTNEWLLEDGKGTPWHELAWEVRGQPLNDLARAFIAGWGRRQPRPQPIQAPPHPDDLPYQVFNKRRWNGLLTRSVLRGLRLARERVWIATGYFVPSVPIRRALRRTARRGIDVRLMLTGAQTDHPAVRYAGRRHYHKLLRAGVKIYETRDKMMHAKAMVIDDDLALVGSANLDNWSLRYNKELNLAVVSRRAAAELTQAMLGYQRASDCISLENWRRRGWGSWLLERVFGIGDEIL